MKNIAILVIWGCLNIFAGCDQEIRSSDSEMDADAPAANPLEEINVSTIVPGEGSIIGPDDSPLHVSFETPGIAPGYSGTVPTDVDVSVTITGDAATPDDPADDWTEEVFSNQDVPLEHITAGSIPLEEVNDGSGLMHGEGLRLDFVVSCIRPSGTFTRDATVHLSYSAGP